MNEQQEIFRLIGENADDMIAVVGTSGQRLYNSPSYQEILGYSPEELAGTTSLEHIHPDDRQIVKEAAEEAQRTGVGRRLEYRFRHKNGTWRILESTASVIPNAQGEPEKMVIINRDITERREIEKRLQESKSRQAQKMEAVGRLSGGIAHDFNNLLGVIIGYTELMEAHVSQGDPLHKSVQEIKKAGERAAALTRQLLAFSRQQVLEPKVLDLNAVVADTRNLLCRLIGEDIELTTILNPRLGRVLADPGQIEQVIMNLAANARDAMPKGGKLIIETLNAELDEAFVRSVVAWIGAETEFPLSQAVASGDAFEHRPSERGHWVQDFSTELDLRDLPGEAAEFEFGADDALPTAHLRSYSAALVVPCCRLPGHAPVAADLGNMAIPNGRITRRLQADHCVLWRWYDHIQGLPIPLPQQISCGRSIVGAVSQKARDRGIQLIQEAG